jgi:hypothetical protein
MNHISWFFRKGAKMKRLGTALVLGVAAAALLVGGESWACGGGRPAYGGNGYGYGFAPGAFGPQAGPARFAVPPSYRPTAFAPGHAYGPAPAWPAGVPTMVARGPARPMPAMPYGMPGYSGPGYGAPMPMAMGPVGYPPVPVNPQRFAGWPGPVGFGTAPAMVSAERVYSRDVPTAAMAVPRAMPYGYGVPYGWPVQGYYGMPPMAPPPYGPMPGYGYPTFGPAPGWLGPRW